MSNTATLERTSAAAFEQAPARARDDAAMLKAAANLTRDLNVPKSAIYWADMLGSALLGYVAMFAAMSVHPTWLAVSAGLVAVLALYRAGSFIHELTHIKKGAVRGFRFSLEPDRWCAAADPELHVRGRSQPTSRQALLRDGRRSRISAARADASMDSSGVPDRGRAGSDRYADPLRNPCAAVDAVRPGSETSSLAAIRACRSIPSSFGRSRKASLPATGRGRRPGRASGPSPCSSWSRLA